MTKNKHLSLKKANIRRTCRIMRVFLLFLMLGIGVCFSNNSYSQSTKISLNLKNKTVKQVFSEIEKNSEFIFFYQDDIIDVNRKVTVNTDNATIEQILNEILSATGNTYFISDRSIYIIRKASDGIGHEKDVVQQTKKTITGTITDKDGESIIGANIVEKGTTNGTVTDVDGRYSLQVENNARLHISYIGYLSQEINTEGKTNLDIVLQEDTKALDELVVVGYGTQRKGSITGAIASVGTTELVVSPKSSAANALAGRLPGLIAHQSSGRPGYDVADLKIRGFDNALVIVDGVEADFRFIDPNQIESVSILKDAAASIYGARAGNGVILVTTKRGVDSKPVITINSSLTYQKPTIMQKAVNSGQYAEMQREAYLNSGQPPENAPFTEEQIQNFYNETDPFLYPNTDWFKETMRDWTPMQNHNLSIRGGSDKIKYYGFLGLMEQKTIFKKNGGEFFKYNFQSNIDAAVSNNLDVKVTIAALRENRNFPYISVDSGEASFWGYLWTTPPIYPVRYPDPTKIPYGGSGIGSILPISNRELAGYNDTEINSLRGTIDINYRIEGIEGLSLRVLGNYLKNHWDGKSFQKPITYYLYDPDAEIYTEAGSFGTKARLSATYAKNQTLTGHASINFDRVFNDRHNVSAMALYEVIDAKNSQISAMRIDFLTPAIEEMVAGSNDGQQVGSAASETGRMSYVGRFNYGYDNKYLLEAILRADASAKFPPGKRWGYFPGVSVGWMMSEEAFMKKISWLDMLKIRISYGEAGYDGIGNFQYLAGYNITSTAYGSPLPYILGNSAQTAITVKELPNQNMTWETMQTYNAGIDFSFLNSKVYGEFDLFYRLREGILGSRANSLPTSIGATLPVENLNSQSNRGFELKIGTKGMYENLFWDVSANISWARAKWDSFDEPDYSYDPDMERLYKKTGRWVDETVIGYISEGLFTSQEEIDNLTYEYPIPNEILSPGDVKWQNTNGDDKLDWRDQVVIGKGVIPNSMYGFNIHLVYKNFDLSALLQGAYGFYKYINFFQGGDGTNKNVLSTFVYENRWTPENNKADLLVFRLGSKGWNFATSDRRFVPADYLRLKEIAFGYNLPSIAIEKLGLQQARVYLSGVNLLTFSKLNKYDLDPESPNNMAGRYYPQQKTVSVGVNLSF